MDSRGGHPSRAESFKSRSDMLLLAAVATGPAHGYDVITSIRQRSGGALNLQEGTVYPALHRLERDGLLSSTWDDTSGRRRRTYRITASGRRALNGEQRAWRTHVAAVNGVLGAGA